jgi:hypothetical protein
VQIRLPSIGNWFVIEKMDGKAQFDGFPHKSSFFSMTNSLAQGLQSSPGHRYCKNSAKIYLKGA